MNDRRIKPKFFDKRHSSRQPNSNEISHNLQANNPSERYFSQVSRHPHRNSPSSYKTPRNTQITSQKYSKNNPLQIETTSSYQNNPSFHIPFSPSVQQFSAIPEMHLQPNKQNIFSSTSFRKSFPQQLPSQNPNHTHILQSTQQNWKKKESTTKFGNTSTNLMSPKNKKKPNYVSQKIQEHLVKLSQKRSKKQNSKPLALPQDNPESTTPSTSKHSNIIDIKDYPNFSEFRNFVIVSLSEHGHVQIKLTSDTTVTICMQDSGTLKVLEPANKTAAFSDIKGNDTTQQYTKNEDGVITIQFKDDSQLLVVIDGVGGNGHGDKATLFLMQSFCEVFYDISQPPTEETIKEKTKRALELYHDKIDYFFSLIKNKTKEEDKEQVCRPDCCFYLTFHESKNAKIHHFGLGDCQFLHLNYNGTIIKYISKPDQRNFQTRFIAAAYGNDLQKKNNAILQFIENPGLYSHELIKTAYTYESAFEPESESEAESDSNFDFGFKFILEKPQSNNTRLECSKGLPGDIYVLMTDGGSDNKGMSKLRAIIKKFISEDKELNPKDLLNELSQKLPRTDDSDKNYKSDNVSLIIKVL